MAKSIDNIIILLASAICFLSLLSLANGQSRFTVEGKVYCDTCRVQFITNLTTYIKGAKVQLGCSEREGGAVTYTVEAETDESGTYRLEVDGDHEDDICSITPLNSPDPECNEINKDPFVKKAAQITLTKNNGIAGSVRSANPLGFLKKTPVSGCPETLQALGISHSDLV